MAAHDEPAEPYREFMREMTLRIERVLQAFAEQMRRDREESRRRFDRQSEESRELLKEIRDLRDESRAKTQALLQVLDRLDNGGAAPAT